MRATGPGSALGAPVPASASKCHGEGLCVACDSTGDGVVKLTELDLMKLQSRTLRLRVGATRPGQRSGAV